MAAFDPAYQKLKVYEGGWANHPQDKGGETYRGIARKAWPSWSGWKRVDQIKNNRVVSATIKKQIDDDAELKAAVRQFFKTEYWDKYGFGLIESQSLAHITWDWSIGTNPRKMAAYAWIALRRSGDAPSPTLTVQELANSKDPKDVFERFKKLRAAHHANVVKADPSQAVFLDGWNRRNNSFVYAGPSGGGGIGYGWVAVPVGLLSIGLLFKYFK